MNYIVQSIPSASYFLNAGKTRVVYDIVRVPSIPERVKKEAEILIQDKDLVKYLGVTENATFTKLEGKQATFWYVKVLNGFNPSQSGIEYYRINASFMDTAELINFDYAIDEEVYKLCNLRSCNPEEDGYTANSIEFRCAELGVFPVREGKNLVLSEALSNNEARIIAKHHNTAKVNVLNMYDAAYQRLVNANSSRPVMSALVECGIL